jgi:hypothetical protein
MLVKKSFNGKPAPSQTPTFSTPSVEIETPREVNGKQHFLNLPNKRA